MSITSNRFDPHLHHEKKKNSVYSGQDDVEFHMGQVPPMHQVTGSIASWSSGLQQIPREQKIWHTLHGCTDRRMCGDQLQTWAHHGLLHVLQDKTMPLESPRPMEEIKNTVQYPNEKSRNEKTQKDAERTSRINCEVGAFQQIPWEQQIQHTLQGCADRRTCGDPHISIYNLFTLFTYYQCQIPIN